MADRTTRDALFFTHDLVYQLQPSANEIPSADLALIHGIESLTATGSLDAEASLYAGAAILGVISSMALNGNLPSPQELAVADATATYDIEYGLSHLSPTLRLRCGILPRRSSNPRRAAILI